MPISELDTINFGMAVENNDIEIFTNSPQRFKDFVQQFGSTNLAVIANVGFSRDGRDNTISPTTGSFQRILGEIALPGVDIEYYRATYIAQRYFPVTKNTTLQAGLTLGLADGYGGNPLPFTKITTQVVSTVSAASRSSRSDLATSSASPWAALGRSSATSSTTSRSWGWQGPEPPVVDFHRRRYGG